jgi:hypothetical protein
MYRIKASINGTAPILFNRMSEEVQDKLQKGQTGGKKSIQVQREAAKLKVYRDDKGNVACPAANIKKSIRVACNMDSLKFGRKGLEPFLNALMFIEQPMVSFGVKEEAFIDERVGRIPPGPRGARVIIYRPGLKEGWELHFTILVVDDRITQEYINQALIAAGIMVGLCDGRPEFGRFEVTHWEVMK